MPELVTNGKTLLFINRNLPASRKELGVKQIEWCTAHLTGFAWPRVQRLADHADAARSETEVG